MLQERFRDLLEIMATFLEHQGYKQSRKKGEFHRPVSGKIIKLRMVLSSRMRGGRVGEIRIFLALEYPELEKIVSLLKEEAYQKGGNLFSQDIGLFCGERIYRSFCFSVDSDMEYVGMNCRKTRCCPLTRFMRLPVNTLTRNCRKIIFGGNLIYDYKRFSVNILLFWSYVSIGI